MCIRAGSGGACGGGGWLAEAAAAAEAAATRSAELHMSAAATAEATADEDGRIYSDLTFSPCVGTPPPPRPASEEWPEW